MTQTAIETARARARRLLQFLKEYQRLKTPPIRNVSEYSWQLVLEDLPRHPSVTVGQAVELEGQGAGAVDGVILRVSRPPQTMCPPPPVVLRGWLIPGWEQVDGRADFLELRNEESSGITRTIRFDADEQRVRARDKWFPERVAWVNAEMPARQVEDVYQRLYALYGQLERASESVQLFLGDGMLQANDTIGVVDHPILLQKIELHFDPSKPEFLLTETDDPPVLAMTLASSLVGSQGEPLADTQQLAKCEMELGQNPNLHPLGGKETKGFLERFVNGVYAKARFVDRTQQAQASANEVFMARLPILFLAPRVGAYAAAIDAAIRRLDESSDIEVPRGLAHLVGIDLEDARPSSASTEASPIGKSPPAPDSAAELLLTRPANPEQELIIRQLDRTGMVLVQGPPGTGKTHTIANLVGHALAQGKTILITSHTAKALRVVREKIVGELQPLCVSLLETDAASRQELQQAVNAIGQELGATSQAQLDAQAATLRREYEDLKKRTEGATKTLRQAVRDEYVDIIVGGEGTQPAQAARSLCEWKNDHDWLPGPVEAGSILPLSTAEIARLYRSNSIIAPADESDLAYELPIIDRLFTCSDFKITVARVLALRQAKVDVNGARTSRTLKRAEIEGVPNWIVTETDKLSSKPAWYSVCVEAGIRGSSAMAEWTELIAIIEAACQASVDARLLALSQDIHELPKGWKLEELIELCDAIEAHLRRGGGLGVGTTMFRPQWRRLLDTTVGRRPPRSVADFQAIAKLARAELQRRNLRSRWKRQIGDLEGDDSPNEDGCLEEYCLQLVPQFREALGWHQSAGREIERILLSGLNYRLSEFVDRQPPQRGPHPTLLRWLSAFRELIPLLERCLKALELGEHEQRIKTVLDYLGAFTAPNKGGPVSAALLQAVKQGDTAAYALTHGNLARLTSLRHAYQERSSDLARIKKVAPSWANAIATRAPPHAEGQPPGDVTRAWQFRQWQQEIDRRSGIDIDCLQREMNDMSTLLQSDGQICCESHMGRTAAPPVFAASEASLTRLATDDYHARFRVGRAVYAAQNASEAIAREVSIGGASLDHALIASRRVVRFLQ